IYRSSNNGDSWIAINNGLSCSNLFSFTINAAGHLFAGSYGCNEGVFISMDNGDSWTPSHNGMTVPDIGGIAINSNNDFFVFANFFTGSGFDTDIYRSVDSGGQWTRINAGLPQTMANAFSVTDGDRICLGTENG